MEHSIKLRRELKKLNVDAALLACADLMALGYEDIDAYILLFPDELKLNLPEKQRRIIIDKKFGSAKFKKLLAARKSRIKESAIPVELEDVELIEGDEVAREILRSAKSAPVGSMERANLFMRYDELRQRNIVETEQNETDNIHFHFPLKCRYCPLFVKFNEMAKDNADVDIRPEMMDGIIRKAIELAYPDVQEAYKMLHGEYPNYHDKKSYQDYERESKKTHKK